MLPGMDPRAMRQAMKKMGISQEDVPAQAVIIVLDGKRLVFESPDVQKIVMQGSESFQISGSYEEVVEEAETSVDESDVKAVMEQTGASEAAAREALEETGDLAGAIIKLSE